jgi:hypothetical protein
MCLGPNFASVAKKILLSTAAFVLWKSAILCAFLGRFWAFSMWNSGQSLRAAGLLSSAGVERATLNKKNFPNNNGLPEMRRGQVGPALFYLRASVFGPFPCNQFWRSAGIGKGMS